jgi:hypothetical protein
MPGTVKKCLTVSSLRSIDGTFRVRLANVKSGILPPAGDFFGVGSVVITHGNTLSVHRIIATLLRICSLFVLNVP